MLLLLQRRCGVGRWRNVGRLFDSAMLDVFEHSAALAQRLDVTEMRVVVDDSTQAVVASWRAAVGWRAVRAVLEHEHERHELATRR